MACFKSLPVLLVFLASLPLPLLAIPIPNDGKLALDTTHLDALSVQAAPTTNGSPTGSKPLSSAITSTSSETTDILSGNTLQGTANVAGNNLLSNNNGNNLVNGNSLVGDVNLLGEQSTADTTTTTTTLTDSANGGNAH